MAKASLPPAAVKLLLTREKISAPLDANFAPVGLAKKYYLNHVSESPFSFQWALVRPEGCVHGKLPVFPEEDLHGVETSIYLIGVLIQEKIWQVSASSLVLSGSPRICEAVKAAFSAGGQYEFEITSMPRVCGMDEPEAVFEVSIVAGDTEDSASSLPPPRAPEKEKKANYYELALKMHPDKAYLNYMSAEEEGGFFALYSELFSSIAKEEEDCEDADKEYDALPAFGTPTDGWSHVAAFYKRWLEFSSRKSFSDANEWKPKDQKENRKLRRAMEDQNKKLRQSAKKGLNTEVRQLVCYVQKRDPRYQVHQKAKMQNNEEKTRRELAEKESRKASKAEERQVRLEAQRLEEGERWKEVDAARQARRERGEAVSDQDSDQSEESEEEVVEYQCEVCRKSFKSEKQFEHHAKSKKHTQAVAAVQKQLAEVRREEGAATGSEEDSEDSEDSKEEEEDSEEEDSKEEDSKEEEEEEVEASGGTSSSRAPRPPPPPPRENNNNNKQSQEQQQPQEQQQRQQLKTKTRGSPQEFFPPARAARAAADTEACSEENCNNNNNNKNSNNNDNSNSNSNNNDNNSNNSNNNNNNNNNNNVVRAGAEEEGGQCKKVTTTTTTTTEVGKREGDEEGVEVDRGSRKTTQRKGEGGDEEGEVDRGIRKARKATQNAQLQEDEEALINKGSKKDQRRAKEEAKLLEKSKEKDAFRGAGDEDSASSDPGGRRGNGKKKAEKDAPVVPAGPAKIVRLKRELHGRKSTSCCMGGGGRR
ncbi:unnamed protein product [Polarella glacialis]|uniref:C2H2-type domain-containing protein n=1 Tax=Polarella glacialis TaxID=89957 RepID=A0A813KZK1_POLGL|nr:unnamed protein product [Polarella glacialis]